MASLNITTKTLELLKQLREKNVHSSNYISSKKEKLHHCTQIVETLNSPNAENLIKFTSLLELSIDTFLDLCDDPDSDVRTVAEESLNKIIKGIDIGYIKKIQIQLYQEINRNGSARSLRAAIWRFGLLSHMIWPVKGKAYVSNLIPCFTRIISRNEEAVIETLANSFPLIMKSLGSFMNDKDVQVLLEATFPRITSLNAVFRRCAVNMILSVCLNSRKSQYFLICVMDYVVNLLSSSSDNMQVIGSFGCLKALLPCMKSSDSATESEKMLNNLILVYEYCLYYTRSPNHNVINAALETLSQLLQMQLVDLTYKLTSPEGLANFKPTVPKETIFSFTAALDSEEIALSSLQSDSSDVLSQDTKILLDAYLDKDDEKEEKEEEDEHDSVTEFCDVRGSSESLSGDTETKTSDPVFELEMKPDLEIGSSQDIDVALKHCCRQLVSSFLLSGQSGGVISDDRIRVSVKSLSLVTIGHIFKLEPSIFFETLSKNDDCQLIRDVLLFADHPDPQIRGNVSVIVALVIKSVFFKYNNSFSNLDTIMFSSEVEKNKFLDYLISILVKGLEDISAITCRQTLIALNVCLKDLLLSAQSYKAERILNCFGKVAKNPYFLVKVKLAEVLAHLPYNVIQFVTTSCEFQDNSISFLVALLGDQDHRVRHAASTAIINIINRLHCRKKIEDLTFNLAMDSADRDCEDNHRDQISILMTLSEFKKIYSNSTNEDLSKIIGLLTETFVSYESKYMLLGCCETLSRLSVSYSPVIYPKAWDCFSRQDPNLNKQSSSKPGNTVVTLSNSIMSCVLHLLCSSSVSLDLMVHKHLLLLAGNLLSGMFLHNYNHDELSGSINRSSFEFVELWECMKNEELSQCYKQLLSHVLKLLNVYVHVIDHVPLVPEKPQAEESPKAKLSFDLKSKKKAEKSPAKEFSNVINSPHYFKMYGILKAAHGNYNVTLDPEASEMYLSLLNTSLDVLSQLLNLASVQDASLIMEDLLRYLQSTSNLAIEKSIECVQQLFKTIFNANVMVQLKQNELAKNLKDIHAYIENSETENDSNKKLYMRYLYSTTQQISNILTTATNKFKDTNDSRRQDKNFVASVIRNIVQSREKKSSMINSIKLFEPMVIKALTQYTHMQNNSVPLQSQVLKLLTQLIKLHINYCSLDSENVFINFVVKQFEFIGDGHVSESALLLPNMLDFLVNLSYTRSHSKVVISVPNIIQLCDGLMASGQPPISHIIPALVPVVEDIFISRNLESTQAEQLELDTTREVLYTMLLKLAEYHQVVELLITCLRETELNDQQGRWKRWSELAVDGLISALKSGSLRIETRGAYMSFVKLFAVINEDAFQPIDPFLRVLLDKSESSPEGLTERKRWAGSVNVILLLLVSKSNEKDILERLKMLGENSSEFKFAKFIFSFIRTVCSCIMDLRKCSHFTTSVETLNIYQESSLYLVEQLTLFLQLCIYLFGCESYSRIAQASEQLVNEDFALSEVHDEVLRVGQFWPIVACKWIHIMTLLKCNLVSFWSKIFKVKLLDGNEREINHDVISRMAVIIFYDYVCQDLETSANLSEWFFENYPEDIVSLANQIPVTNLTKFSAFLLHRPNVLSNLRSTGPSFFKNLLLCFESAHQSQSGAVVYNLVLILARIKYVALIFKAVTICCQRIDTLLNMNAKSVIEQLSNEDFEMMVQTITTHRQLLKRDNLVSSVNRLGAQFYSHNPIDRTEKPMISGTPDAKTADKDWFVSKVKKQCRKSESVHLNDLWEVAQLLSKLDADDCRTIVSSPDFNIKLLRNCLILGARLTVEEFQNGKSLLHSSLYDVARNCLFDKIKVINQKVPKSDMILSSVFEEVSNGTLDVQVLEYYKQVLKFLNDRQNWYLIFQVIPSVTTYMKILETLPDYNINYINQDHKDELIEFSSLCSDLLQWILYKTKIEADYSLKPHELELCLQCIECINKEPSINKDLNSAQHYLKVCSLARAITETLEHFVEVKTPLVRIQTHALNEALKNRETRLYAEACLQSANLVLWLESKAASTSAPDVPEFLARLIKSLIVSLSRQSLVNSFVLTPPQAWKAHYSVVGAGPTRCHFSIMSSESNLLNEGEILEQFVYRLTLLGWTNRLQFEEMWMALLGVVNVYQLGESQPEEIGTISHVNVLLIRAITRLLLQMLLLPVPGNPNSGTPVYTARDPEPLSLIQNYDKLFRLQDLVLWKYEDLKFFKGSYAFKVEHVFLRGNIERKNNVNEYSYSQVSVPYLWSLCGLHESKSDVGIQELVRRRNETLKTESIDLQSCLQFLLELYTSWSNYCGSLSLCMRNEIIKSLQSISELFLKRYQFQWMLDTCLAMVQMHSLDDGVFLQYVVFAVCKAAAVLTPLDKDTQEKVLLLLEAASKSNFLSVRIAVVHSVLYLLQGSTLLHCDDLTNSVTSIVSEEISKFQNRLDSVDLSTNEEMSSIMWALVFFILEHVKDVKTNIELASTVEHALSVIENPKISTSLHQTIVQGLERLVLVRPMNEDLFNRIIRVAIDNLKRVNPILSIPAIQLLLSCMYVEAAQAGTLSISLVDEVELENKPEMLVKSIERSSVLFDKIKKAYHDEVEILCEVVSGIFNDFFFTSNILTKVIGEFLSMQQQHPKLMSSVVFKVCERTNNSSQLDLLQEWVLFSLPNFIDNLPVAMSTWFLSCFFVSLSKNPWLQYLFPHVQCRIGKYEFEDKSILSMAAMDFYEQLTSETRKEEFVKIFNVAGKKLGSPFNDVAICFQ